jgi:hypothetical protein
MSAVVLFGIFVTVPAQAKVAERSPIELQLRIEVELLDREIQRRHDTVLYTRGRLTSARRLTGRSAASASQLDRLALELRTQEALEQELKALRSLKVHDRDVLARPTPAETARAYDLLLDWVKARVAVATIELERQTVEYERVRALGQNRGSTRQNIEDAELAHRVSAGKLAEIQAKEAQVLLERASAPGAGPADSKAVDRLRAEYAQARLRSAETQAKTAARRLEVAEDRVRLKLMPESELAIFEKASIEAAASLEAEKKAVDPPQAGPDVPPSRPS